MKYMMILSQRVPPSQRCRHKTKLVNNSCSGANNMEHKLCENIIVTIELNVSVHVHVQSK